jgi:hypothetical protein
MSAAAEAHSVEVFTVPYQRVAGLYHKPVRVGVPREALVEAEKLGKIAGSVIQPLAAKQSTASQEAPKAPAKTVSAAEYRQLKHSHITHKLGMHVAATLSIHRCLTPRPPLHAGPSERLAAPQTESHVVGWRAKESRAGGSNAFSEALQGRGTGKL